MPLGSSSFARTRTPAPTLSPVVVSRPGFRGTSGVPFFDLWSPFPDEPVVSTGAEVVQFSTALPVSGDVTAYIGPGGVSLTRSLVEFPLMAGTTTKIAVLDELTGGTRTYTLMKNGSPTSLTVTLSGSTQTATATGSVTWLDTDKASIQLVKSGCPSGRHTVALKHAPS